MRAVLFMLCLFASLATSGSSSAQAPSAPPRLLCHDYQKIAETLGERYGEQPVSLGLQTNGHLLQVFTSATSGGWTILSIAPSGLGCIIAAGRNWQTQQPVGAGAPA